MGCFKIFVGNLENQFRSPKIIFPLVALKIPRFPFDSFEEIYPIFNLSRSDCTIFDHFLKHVFLINFDVRLFIAFSNIVFHGHDGAFLE